METHGNVTMNELRPQRAYHVHACNENLGAVKSQVDAGYFDFDAPYQRGHVWSLEQKERLIDSLLGGLGIPPIYIINREVEGDGPWRELLDGKQRLSALVEFMDDKFPYHVNERAIWWHDLTMSAKRRFSNLGLSVFIVTDVTPEDAWEIFRRVNFCGVQQSELDFEARRTGHEP